MTTPTPDTRGIYQPSLSSFTIHNITQLYFIGTFEAIHHQDNTIRGTGQLKHETKHIKTSFCHITLDKKQPFQCFLLNLKQGLGLLVYITFILTLFEARNGKLRWFDFSISPR